jgi:mannose-6-phosphate isomerase-like protein (cupin superfamily)
MDLSKFAGYKHVPKVWGEEIWLHNSPLYCAKLLVLTPGMQCSLHRHLVKTETFFLLQGLAMIEVGADGHKELKHSGDSVHIPVGTYHRFGHVSGVLTSVPTVILEVSSHHDDADVERLEESGPIV